MSFQSRSLDVNPIPSKGPITNAGKAISSQNARKHGLNAPPDGALVTLWFNVILNNCGDDHEEPSAAEARYHRALHKVDIHESEPGSAQQIAMKLRQEIWDVLEGVPKELVDGPPDPYELAYANFAIKQLVELFSQIGHERRLYNRYLGEARAQRAKALRAWCAFNQDEDQNSRNELKLPLKGE